MQQIRIQVVLLVAVRAVHGKYRNGNTRTERHCHGNCGQSIIEKKTSVTNISVNVGIIYVAPSRKQCSSSSDCKRFPGANCWHSQCTSGGARCAYDSDCRMKAAACIYARCIKLYQSCRESADCPFYPVTSCRGSVCVKQLAQSRECSSQYDCLQYPGTVCSYGRCERVEEIDCVGNRDCPSGTVCRNRRCVKGRPSQQPTQSIGCRSDTDCLSLSGAYCVKGHCLVVEQIGCRTDGDCPPEAQCVNGRCSKKSESSGCRTDTDCRQYPEIYCVAGKCLKVQEIICSTDNDCPPATWCINGKCAKISQSNACRTDVDCYRYPGTYCLSGRCRKLEDIGCQRDSECPAGAQCVDQKCRKQERCTKDEDCLLYPQMSCINSNCVTVRRECTQDSDCPYRPHTACIASRCEKVRQPCKHDTDCIFYPDVKCIAGYCAKDGEKCTADRDCPNYPATRCVASKCVAVGGSCSKDEECPAYPYLECTNSKCQKVPAPCRSDNDCDQNPPRECIYELCIKRRYCSQTWDCPLASEVSCKGNQCVSLVGSCNSDPDCAVYGSRRYCIKTTCVRLDLPCSQDSNCPFHPETSCVNSTCMKVPQTTTTRATAATTTSMILSLPNKPFASSTCPGVYGMTDAARKLMLNMHNRYRSQTAKGQVRIGDGGMLPHGGNILKFVYRCVLELDAYNYAKQCTLHGSTQSSRYKQGENYHVGPLTNSFIQAGRRAMRSWFSTKKYGINPNKYTGATPADPFVAIVWGKTWQMGCASVTCSSKTVTVCRYNERGLEVGFPIYFVGAPCSFCANARCSASEGLCLIN